jgi:hypothetical protein
MNPRLLFLFFLFISASGLAQRNTGGTQQFAFEYWHDGKIILDTGDTLRGQVKYNMQNDLIQLLSKNKLETYTARKIVTFEIFDITTKRYRLFYSLPYAFKGQYKAPVFFELIEEGKMTLLAREVLEVKTYSSYYSYGASTRIVLVNKFFFLKDDGSILPFSGKKNDMIQLMGTKGEEVEKYIKEHKLNFDRKYDVGRIVEYYNSLFKR